MGIYSPMLSIDAVQVSWPQHTSGAQMSDSGLTDKSDCFVIKKSDWFMDRYVGTWPNVDQWESALGLLPEQLQKRHLLLGL